MGRRSTHTPEELRDLIVRAATEIIERDGLAGLSAREVARRIGYSPGTIYNVFQNLDDVVLTVEGRLLDDLAAELSAIPKNGNAVEHVQKLAATYLEFTHRNPKLWNLLFEHHLPSGHNVPQSYQSKLESLLAHVEQAMAPLVQDPNNVKRSARVLWAGVHGLTSLSTTDKLSIISSEAAGPLVHDLVAAYISGLKADAAKTGSK